jgi:hypothetical protein
MVNDMSIPHHFGDPCIHCGVTFDDMQPGPCNGELTKAKVLTYCVDRHAWQNPGNGRDTVLCKMSSGYVLVEYPDAGWPYREPFLGAEVMARDAFRRRFNYTAP